MAVVARQLSQPLSPSAVRGTSVELGRTAGITPEEAAFPAEWVESGGGVRGWNQQYLIGPWVQPGLQWVSSDEL